MVVYRHLLSDDSAWRAAFDGLDNLLRFKYAAQALQRAKILANEYTDRNIFMLDARCCTT